MARSTRKNVEVEGLAQVQDALDELSKATSGNILKRAVSTAGAMIADAASALAPKKRGFLKINIMVGKAKIITAGKAAFAKAMQEGGTRAEAAAAARAANSAAGGSGRSAVTQVGPTKAAGQGILQEFGTVHHKAQPFMRPAWDAHGEAAIEVIKETLIVEVDKATKRAEKKAAKLAAAIAAGK